MMSNATRVSAKGAAFIAAFEGFSSAPYQDSVGVWTIGYGHTEGVGPHSRHLTQREALDLLRRDLDQKYGASVARQMRSIGQRLSQKQFDALVSIAYNVGPGVVGLGYGLGQALSKGDRRLHPVRWRTRVGDAFLLYNHAGGRVLAGLTRRRKAERKLWMGWGYDTR